MVRPKITRFQVWLVELGSTRGREINKTRPCVIISPEEMEALSTVLVAPMTTRGFHFPCRVVCDFQGKQGMILLDQIRAVDKTRLVRHLGEVNEIVQRETCRCLQELFAY